MNTIPIGSMWQFSYDALPTLFSDNEAGDWIKTIDGYHTVLILGHSITTDSYRVIVFPSMSVGRVCTNWFSNNNIECRVVKRII